MKKHERKEYEKALALLDTLIKQLIEISKTMIKCLIPIFEPFLEAIQPVLEDMKTKLRTEIDAAGLEIVDAGD
jgi:hypothetical protein